MYSAMCSTVTHYGPLWSGVVWYGPVWSSVVRSLSSGPHISNRPGWPNQPFMTPCSCPEPLGAVPELCVPPPGSDSVKPAPLTRLHWLRRSRWSQQPLFRQITPCASLSASQRYRTECCRRQTNERARQHAVPEPALTCAQAGDAPCHTVSCCAVPCRVA